MRWHRGRRRREGFIDEQVRQGRAQRRRAVVGKQVGAGGVVHEGDGYIDLSAIKEFGANIGGTFILPGLISLPASPTSHRDGQFYLTALRSRLDITTQTPTAMGNVGTVPQGNFCGAGDIETVANSYGFRLRLAYATVVNWTLG